MPENSNRKANIGRIIKITMLKVCVKRENVYEDSATCMKNQ